MHTPPTHKHTCSFAHIQEHMGSNTHTHTLCILPVKTRWPPIDEIWDQIAGWSQTQWLLWGFRTGPLCLAWHTLMRVCPPRGSASSLSDFWSLLLSCTVPCTPRVASLPESPAFQPLYQLRFKSQVGISDGEAPSLIILNRYDPKK